MRTPPPNQPRTSIHRDMRTLVPRVPPTVTADLLGFYFDTLIDWHKCWIIARGPSLSTEPLVFIKQCGAEKSGTLFYPLSCDRTENSAAHRRHNSSERSVIKLFSERFFISSSCQASSHGKPRLTKCLASGALRFQQILSIFAEKLLLNWQMAHATQTKTAHCGCFAQPLFIHLRW